MRKKISGSFFERYIFSYFLYFFPTSILILFIKNEFSNVKLFLYMNSIMIVTSFIIFLFDYFNIKRRYPLKDIFVSKKFIIEDYEINNDEILEIIPITTNKYRWSLNIIEIKTSNHSIYFLDKPLIFIENIIGKKSRSIKLIEECFPELKSKIKDRIEIEEKEFLKNMKQ